MSLNILSIFTTYLAINFFLYILLGFLLFHFLTSNYSSILKFFYQIILIIIAYLLYETMYSQTLGFNPLERNN
jgi:hypothetical protein